jgi:hypothetical protein
MIEVAPWSPGRPAHDFDHDSGARDSPTCGNRAGIAGWSPALEPRAGAPCRQTRRDAASANALDPAPITALLPLSGHASAARWQPRRTDPPHDHGPHDRSRPMVARTTSTRLRSRQRGHATARHATSSPEKAPPERSSRQKSAPEKGAPDSRRGTGSRAQCCGKNSAAAERGDPSAAARRD